MQLPSFRSHSLRFFVTQSGNCSVLGKWCNVVSLIIVLCLTVGGVISALEVDSVRRCGSFNQLTTPFTRCANSAPRHRVNSQPLVDCRRSLRSACHDLTYWLFTSLLATFCRPFFVASRFSRSRSMPGVYFKPGSRSVFLGSLTAWYCSCLFLLKLMFKY